MTTKNELKSMIADPEKLIDFIISLIGEDYDGPVGLRGLYKNESMGNLSNSMVWEDGNMTDEEIDGTCVVGIASNWKDAGYRELEAAISKHAAEALKYGNGKVGLVVGEGYAEMGNDFWSNEMIVGNAKVIYVWK